MTTLTQSRGPVNRDAEDDTFLTHTGPGTPCGEYLRRHWHPFMLASELADLPVTVRIMSEDLVAFRDRSGRIGLLHKHCIHRGTSLEFGIPEERGIRCCYHGWHFDIDGTILETPAEPPTSRIRENFVQGAYPVREYQGLLFTYMGPPERTPEFPILDTFEHPADNTLTPFRFDMPCNWLQVVENACDPVHTSFLHAIVSRQQFASSFKVLPALDFVETPLGFLSQATRRVKDFLFVRSSDIILPNIGQFTGNTNNADRETLKVSCGRTRWQVPIDDYNSQYIGYVHRNSVSNTNVRDRDLGVDRAAFIGQTPDRPYEERQREPGDYDAVGSQGRIANRRAEHLGTTDRGIVMFRRMLRRAIEATIDGREPEKAAVLTTGSGHVRTYAHEYALAVAPDSPLSSMDTLLDFGRRASELIVELQELPPEERERVALERIRAML